jgi:hypothetical protein
MTAERQTQRYPCVNDHVELVNVPSVPPQACPSSGRALSQLARLFRRRHGDLKVWNKHQEIPESINLYKSTGLRSILIRNARLYLPYKPEPSS